jgi:hypothetical protein
MGSFGTWFPEPCRRYSFESQSGQSAFDAYRQLLVLAHERKVALHLLTSPAHAHLFESMRVVGLWDTFETWKRRLAAINEEVARQLGVEPFPLFDFAVFDPATTEESVPPASSTETMRFYWETSHYTPALGEHVLDRVLGTTPPSEVAPGGFGVALTSASMQEHLVAVREAEGRYREAHPTDVAVLERIAAETADWRAGGTCGPRL